MLSGASDIKEQSAVGFGEVIQLTSPESLRLSIVVVTGPLIRVLGERLTPIAKAALIETLSVILERVLFYIYLFIYFLNTAEDSRTEILYYRIFLRQTVRLIRFRYTFSYENI